MATNVRTVEAAPEQDAMGRPVHQRRVSDRLLAAHNYAYATGSRRLAEELREMIDAAKAREQQLVASYQKTLQESFREVRQALASQTRAREVFEAEAAREAALTDTLRLARIRQENGFTSQLEVIDAERNLLLAQLNRITALRDRRTAVADVVRALGGGWQGLEAVAVGSAAK